MKQGLKVLLGMGALIGASAVHAHQIWIEQTASAAHVYFGEFDRNLKETSPGRIDKLAMPKAVLIGSSGERELPLSKGDNSFVIAGHAAAGESIAVEEANTPVVEYKNGDVLVRAARTLGARFASGSAALVPKLTLDLVPTGKPDEFRIYYKGQPQPKLKVGAIIQSGWMLEAVSNSEGVVKFELPWQGRYVLEVRYADKNPGQRAGADYDTLNYMTTLSFVKKTGLKALPLHAVTAPSM